MSLESTKLGKGEVFLHLTNPTIDAILTLCTSSNVLGLGEAGRKDELRRRQMGNAVIMQSDSCPEVGVL